MAVIAAFSLFLALIAQNAVLEIKGSALIIVNCIDFLITIINILILNQLSVMTSSLYIYSLMGIGTIFGLVTLKKDQKKIYN